MEKNTYGGAHGTDFADKCLRALHEKDRLSFAGRFVQGFVHNANGPLQNLSMLTEMLLSGLDIQDRMFRANAGDDPKWTEILAKQRKRLTQMRDQIYGLAGDLREFMHLNDIERNGTDIDINALLSSILKVFRSDLFFKHHVSPELQLTKNLPRVKIPGQKIIPAIFHLIQNAITAMQDAADKKLVIETRGLEDHLLVRFIDSGCGLRECHDTEPLFHLFESRWPAASDRAKKDHMGFGLYAARQLLSPYGCTVSLECGAEGTSAIVRIPLSAGNKTPA
ncbi:MAG: ATP-binding protein [Syntrophobacteraceae bacterium]